MSQPPKDANENTPAEPPRMVGGHDHNLSWIAMAVMAGLSLLALLYAGSINLE